MKKISIITINLNDKKGLKKTIESVINQTYKNIEYIIIDGGSTDGSIDIIKGYEGKFNYWVSEPDKGIYNAMNKGISVASGDYLQFLNSGDWLVNDSIIQDIFEIERNADLVYGHLNYLYDDGVKLFKALSEDKISLAYFIHYTLPHPSTFIKKILFKESKYDESFKYVSDKKFFIEKSILQNCSLQQVDLTVVNFNTYGVTSNTKLFGNEVQAEQEIMFAQLIPERIMFDYPCHKQESKSCLFKFFEIIKVFLNQIKYKDD